MKANEAPEKLYLISNGLISYCRNTDEDVEYTRTDAFMKKACEWLKENGGSYWMDDYDLPTDDLVKDFRSFMKGE